MLVYFYFNVYDCFSHMCICARVRAWCLRRPEEVSGILELELEMVVSHHVGTGFRFSARAVSMFDH